MENKNESIFRKGVREWVDEVDDQTKKRQKQAMKESPDYYYM